MWERRYEALISGLGYSRLKSMYIVEIWPTRAAPPDVQEEPGRALDVHSHRLLPWSYPVWV